MNYEEMEALYREERLALDHQLSLQPEAISPAFFKQKWGPVKSVNFIHRLGAGTGIVYATLAFILAFVQWQDWYASIPLVLSGLALVTNGWFFPAQTLPTTNLERYSVADLIDQLVAFRRYAMHRIWFDGLVVTLFVAALMLGILNFSYGINPFTELASVPTRFWLVGFGLFPLSIMVSVLGNARQMRQLREIEHELAGYREDDLV